MAGYNRNRYQYETSPRKLEPEYRPIQKKYPKKSTAAKKSNISTKKSINAQTKTIKAQYKAILYVVVAFAILFAISYRNTVISEKYSHIKEVKSDLATIEKENEQMEVSIESKTNLGTIEKEAKEKLGMKKLDDNQAIYVNLDKKDYVESMTDEIVKNNNQNIFQKIIAKIQNIF